MRCATEFRVCFGPIYKKYQPAAPYTLVMRLHLFGPSTRFGRGKKERAGVCISWKASCAWQARCSNVPRIFSRVRVHFCPQTEASADACLHSGLVSSDHFSRACSHHQDPSSQLSTDLHTLLSLKPQRLNCDRNSVLAKMLLYLRDDKMVQSLCVRVCAAENKQIDKVIYIYIFVYIIFFFINILGTF